ncbi:ATP-dependent DNA helicase DDX11-like [Bolinopsis microptera]|uniref:ATP-dependent DNA helicase DDX11-like n=1 Tax=Bolinopsis microptera TaxID=2820187 RepID=UPI003078EC74
MTVITMTVVMVRSSARKKSDDDENKDDEKKKKKKGKCEFYSSQNVRDYSSHILSEVQDIEGLVGGAKEAETCPYYSTRAAVPEAEVVMLPYNMILHGDQRKSLNIRLKDSVVIIDEAHNLIETINEIHSITIHEKDCITTHRKLAVYLRKVKARLKPINLLHCKQVIHCVSLLASSFKKIHFQKAPRTYLLTIGDFQTKSDLADINLFDLVKYIRESHLAQKVQGYEDDVIKPTTDVTIHSTSVLVEISSLFTALTNADSAGRVLVVCEAEGSFVRYISLNSEDPFLPLLRECRSVVLAGGTMEPVGEVQQQLLASSSRDVTLFSCGHVIPPQNLLPITLSHGKDMELDFSFEGRKKPGTFQEVGNILLDLCQVVPGGLVCFFPSYKSLTDCKSIFQKSGHVDKISKIKTLFCDEAGSKNSDGILEQYSKRELID